MSRSTKQPAAAKQTPPPAKGFIDAALMERAIKLRGEGMTMEGIGAKLGVKSTAYLAKKIKETYGADALAKPAAQPVPQPQPAKRASRAAKPARKPATAKEA